MGVKTKERKQLSQPNNYTTRKNKQTGKKTESLFAMRGARWRVWEFGKVVAQFGHA